MSASLSDILTTQKNGVVALNNIASNNIKFQGTATSATVTANTLVVIGKGRLVNYAVVVAGTGVGGVYDSATIADAAAANQLCATVETLGVFETGQIFTNGLVIKPGAGQSINVTYALG